MNLRKKASYILVILIFVLLFWKIVDNFDQIKNVQGRFQPKNLVLLFLVLLPGPFVNAFSWHLMTKFLGGDISLMDNIKIWTFSNATRFFPGSVWQYAGRVYMLSQKGVSKTFTTTALLMEAALNIAMGSLFVLLALNFWPLNIPSLIRNVLVPVVALVVLGIIVLTSSRVALLETIIKRIFKNDLFKLSKIRLKWLLVVLVSILAQFLLAGFSLLLISASFISIGLDKIILFTGIYAASWLVGYLTFLAPSGLGVREASVAGLLTFLMPFPLGSLIAIVSRLASLVSEAITVFVVFLFVQKRTS